ncbi:flavodoxin domain-containing protein [Serpentinicella alkaliphila]|uniref:Menaquinone-dependent protoporphyrinogen oxidase n=1 Tax=Serpentinicella alkaliphila TaxID=1734049 RepID=A0A4R2TF00_9FIRM|nr:flavodoxin domain-containing protein [Serpentinicella alkaliphila]QUH27056.1 flavodoxin domain-containing protein [Serpentinicella alkaliphila]TCP93282.1 menaquinone-dependent protoporphyrinogen oxidase [Serpentinicella alkaliphila]
MKTLIVYSTKYGCTEKCAKKLSEKLKGSIDLVNLKEGKKIDISLYDKVIIGGSIYIGKIQNEVVNFCKDNLQKLISKKIGLFVCSMREGESIEEQIRASFPQELRLNAVAIENFGGEFIFNKMGFLDKLITKKVVKIDKDTSNILEDNINNFAQLMNS